MTRSTANFTVWSNPNTSAINIAHSAPSTVSCTVTQIPSRIDGMREPSSSRLSPKFSKKPLKPPMDRSPPPIGHGQRAPSPGRGAQSDDSQGDQLSLQGVEVTLAEQLGGHLLRGQLLGRETEVPDDRQVPVLVGDDLRQHLVVGVQQAGVLVPADGATRAVLQHTAERTSVAQGTSDGTAGAAGRE